MALAKKDKKFGRKTTSVRTGGFVGETTMEDMEDWVKNGAGVSEDVVDVGDMPNERVMRKTNRRRVI